jgi:hypothetical protein
MMKACLIGWHPVTGDVVHQEVESIDQGYGLHKSIARDYPGYDWTVMADAEARKAHAEKVMAEYEAMD